MTEERQRQRQGQLQWQRQEPIQGSFALLEDDGEKQATAMAETSNSNGNAVG